MVRIVPGSLIDDVEIREIDDDLAALIDSGRDRMACPLLLQRRAPVEPSRRLGNSGPSSLSESRRPTQRCAPRSQVAEVFSITNLHRLLEVHADEALALRSAWPQQGSARPKVETKDATARASTGQAAVGANLARVRLLVMAGRAKGRFIEVGAPRFLIGRDTSCQLGPDSQAVSRVHTVIEQREGRAFVRDCGTVNGTRLGDRTLHAEGLEAKNGGRFQVGTRVFTITIKDQHSHAESLEPRNPAIACRLDEHDTDPEAPPATTCRSPHPPRTNKTI